MEYRKKYEIFIVLLSFSLCIFLKRYNAQKMLKNPCRLFCALYFAAKDTRQKGFKKKIVSKWEFSIENVTRLNMNNFC